MKDVLLHLSDLHCGQTIDDYQTEMFPAHYVQATRRLASAEILNPKHSKRALSALAVSLGKALRDRVGSGGDFLGIAVTGDLSTYAYGTDSINGFPFQFITGRVRVDGMDIGLQLGGKPVLAALGNHDKWRMSYVPEAFVQSKFMANGRIGVSHRTSKLDYSIQLESKSMRRAYVFFCLDSNYYLPDTVARGEFSLAQEEWLVGELASISKNGVTGTGGTVYRRENREIVITLLVHHPPVIAEQAKLGWMNILFGSQMGYVNDTNMRLTRSIAKSVDVVLSGHYHVPFISDGATPVVAAGCASAWNLEDKYSFNFIEYGEKSLLAHRYAFQGGRFVPDGAPEEVGDLAANALS